MEEFMLRFNGTVLAFILVVSFSSASAETYTWTDDQGTIHFTEDLGTVPEKIRTKALREEEINSAPEETSPSKAPLANAPEATRQPVPSGGNGDNGIFNGKTYEQWQNDLTEREAALEAIRKRIEEVAALRKNLAARKDERDKLFAEHKSLLEKYKEMKARYFEQVENARKAGLTVNLQP